MPTIDATDFHTSQLPELLRGDRGRLAAEAATGIRGPLVLDVGEATWTYQVQDGAIEIRSGAVEEPWVRVALTPEAWSDLATFMRTAIALQLSGELTFTLGSFGRFGAWEGVLRALYLGIPAYDADRVSLEGSDGVPLALDRRFTLDDSDEELNSFLATTGFLHVRGVFSAEEVAQLQAETERIGQVVDRADPFTWWAQRPDGTEVLCRVIYADRISPLMGELATDPRCLRLVGLVDTPLAPYLDRMDGATLLTKPAGELRGLSNLPWHQDCGLGLHPFICPAIAIGVQITGASAERGQFVGIAGSHGQSVPSGVDPDSRSDWPRVALDTEAGDVTIHVADLLHASPPPAGQGGRTTLYLSYYPATLPELIGPGQAANDLIRGRQLEADGIRAGAG